MVAQLQSSSFQMGRCKTPCRSFGRSHLAAPTSDADVSQQLFSLCPLFLRLRLWLNVKVTLRRLKTTSLGFS